MSRKTRKEMAESGQKLASRAVLGELPSWGRPLEFFSVGKDSSGGAVPMNYQRVVADRVPPANGCCLRWAAEVVLGIRTATVAGGEGKAWPRLSTSHFWRGSLCRPVCSCRRTTEPCSNRVVWPRRLRTPTATGKPCGTIGYRTVVPVSAGRTPDPGVSDLRSRTDRDRKTRRSPFRGGSSGTGNCWTRCSGTWR